MSDIHESDGTTEDEMISLLKDDAREVEILKLLEELAPGSVHEDGTVKLTRYLGDKMPEWDGFMSERAKIQRRRKQMESR